MRIKRNWIAIVAVGLGLAATGAAFAAPAVVEPGMYHKVVMKGDLLEVNHDGSIYLCVGTRDGAKAGQQLDVYRYRRASAMNPKHGARFERQKIGKLEVIEIVDKHFANAKLVEGKLKVGDVAELESDSN